MLNYGGEVGYMSYILSRGGNERQRTQERRGGMIDEKMCGVYSHAFARARGSSCTCPCTSVSLTEDTVSVDANASQLGSRPKALSGIEFHQTSFNQQVFKVRITLPLLQPAGQG